MRHRNLEVTCCKGCPLAACLYLPRTAGTKAALTLEAGAGMRVDFDAKGVPTGVEITAPALVTVDDLHAVLALLGVEELAPEQWVPPRRVTSTIGVYATSSKASEMQLNSLKARVHHCECPPGDANPRRLSFWRA